MPFYDARATGPVTDIIRRRIAQMKAAGQIISPATEQALIEADLNSAAENAYRSRALSESTRQFDVSQANRSSEFAQTMDQRNKEMKAAQKGQTLQGIGSLAGSLGTTYTLGKAAGLWGGNAVKAVPQVVEGAIKTAPGIGAPSSLDAGMMGLPAETSSTFTPAAYEVGQGVIDGSITGEAAGAFGGTSVGAGTGATATEIAAADAAATEMMGGTVAKTGAGSSLLGAAAGPLAMGAGLLGFMSLMGAFGPDPEQDLGVIPAQRIETNLPLNIQAAKEGKMSQDDIFSMARDLRESNRGMYIPEGMTQGGSGPITNASAYYYRPEYKQAVDQIMAQNYGADWESKARPLWEFQDRVTEYNRVYGDPANYSDQNLGRTELIKAIQNDPYQGAMKDAMLKDIYSQLYTPDNYSYGGP